MIQVFFNTAKKEGIAISDFKAQVHKVLAAQREKYVFK